jgi:hypothetical protein
MGVGGGTSVASSNVHGDQVCVLKLVEKMDYCSKILGWEAFGSKSMVPLKVFFLACEFLKFLKMMRVEVDEIRYTELFTFP